MASLDSLKELYAWMRTEGIPYARCGELELRIGPTPASPAVVEVDPPADPADVERRNLELLLHSSGADITPFLRRQ